MALIAHLKPSWKSILSKEIRQPYFNDIEQYLISAEAQNKVIFPDQSYIFEAFNRTTLHQIKVVIIGQDPYHREGQAMGLSFSVPKSVRIPPSLRNIYKEILNDLGHEIPTHGDLTQWANQGVLLLNSILTVESGQPGSHRKIGWEVFTDRVIEFISNQKKHVVFLLWGAYAKSKSKLINKNKHLILESAHPSPLARNKFMNNHHFSKTNKYLIENKLDPINWKII